VAAVSRILEIAPTAATRRPDDAVVTIDLDAADRARIEPSGPGTVVVRGSATWAAGAEAAASAETAEAPPTRAQVGPPRSTPGGSSVVEVVVDGWRFELEVEDARRAALRRRASRATDAAASSGPTEIRAIIPGRVATVRVIAGDVVEAGQSLLVVEAMKMQNELRTPRAGTIERVAVGEGETIDHGDLLVVLR
jgi:biotin carboxyl carrier protein